MALTVAALSTASGCESKPRPTTNPTSARSASAASSAVSATPPGPISASSGAAPAPARRVVSDGFAYLATSKKVGDDSPGKAPTLQAAYELGLVAVEPDGRVRSIAMPGKAQFGRVLRASDGNPYVLATHVDTIPFDIEAFRVEATTLKSVARVAGCGRATGGRAFDARDESIAILCGDDLRIRRKEAADFVTVRLPERGLHPILYVTSSGSILFGSMTGLFEYKAAGWTRLETAQGAGEALSFFETPGGIHATLHGQGLVRLGPKAVTTVRELGPGDHALLASSNGQFARWISTKETVALATVEAEKAPVPTTATLRSQAAVDDRGRIWNVEKKKLIVVDGATGVVQPGVDAAGLPELRDVADESVVLIGRGPELPLKPSPAKNH